ESPAGASGWSVYPPRRRSHLVVVFLALVAEGVEDGVGVLLDVGVPRLHGRPPFVALEREPGNAAVEAVAADRAERRVRAAQRPLNAGGVAAGAPDGAAHGPVEHGGDDLVLGRAVAQLDVQGVAEGRDDLMRPFHW